MNFQKILPQVKCFWLLVRHSLLSLAGSTWTGNCQLESVGTDTYTFCILLKRLLLTHSLFAAHDYNCCQWNSLCRSSRNCLDPWAELADTHHLMHFWQTNQFEGQSLPSTQLGLKLSLLTIHITEVFKLIWHVKWMHTNCCVLQTNIHKKVPKLWWLQHKNYTAWENIPFCKPSAKKPHYHFSESCHIKAFPELSKSFVLSLSSAPSFTSRLIHTLCAPHQISNNSCHMI